MNNSDGGTGVLSPEQHAELIQTLKSRFAKHQNRHPGLDWYLVEARLEARPEKLWSLQQMEATGGEPDAIELDASTGEVVFCDCAAETPKGRRSVCYDQEARETRKEHAPASSATEMAQQMGIVLLTEAEYRHLQQLGNFDSKTSSWIETPAHIRSLGGALYGDRRYNQVFIYHNGASSYYAARGFRGRLRV